MMTRDVCVCVSSSLDPRLEVHQRDARGSVGVVFDASHGSRDVAEPALEVHHAIQSLVSPASVPHRDSPVVVTPA